MITNSWVQECKNVQPMRVYDQIFMSERLGCEGFRGLRSTLSFIISPFD